MKSAVQPLTINTTDTCVLGISPYAGEGIFARFDLKRGDTIGEITGMRHRFFNKTVSDVLGHERWIGLGNNEWIDPQFPFSYINHSCNPNAGIAGTTTVFAMRDIKKGEEITFDYSTTEEDARWVLPGGNCLCGEENCRGEIRSIHFLPRQTFEKYLPYIPDHFISVYQKYHEL